MTIGDNHVTTEELQKKSLLKTVMLIISQKLSVRIPNVVCMIFVYRTNFVAKTLLLHFSSTPALREWYFWGLYKLVWFWRPFYQLSSQTWNSISQIGVLSMYHVSFYSLYSAKTNSGYFLWNYCFLMAILPSNDISCFRDVASDETLEIFAAVLSSRVVYLARFLTIIIWRS